MLALQEFLPKLHDWTEYESRLYCAIIENGPMKANDLSIKAGIPAGRIYEIIKKLHDRGMLKRIQSRPAMYEAQNPRTVMEIVMEQLRKDMKDPLEKAEEAWDVRQGRVDTDNKALIISGIYGIRLEFRRMCSGIKKTLKIIDSDPAWVDHKDLETFRVLIDNNVEVSVTSVGSRIDILNRLASIGVNTYTLPGIDMSFATFDAETVMLKFVSPDKGTVIRDRSFSNMFSSKFDELVKKATKVTVDQIDG